MTLNGMIFGEIISHSQTWPWPYYSSRIDAQ